MEQNNNKQFNYDQRTMPQQPPMRPVIPPIKRTKNKFLTFFTALIPGAGQMYHGLIKKGLSIMVIFWGIIGISVLLYIPVINFILPVVWFYSFFDAVNRMNSSLDELKMLKDDYVYPIESVNFSRFTNIFKRRHLWIGWTLTVIGFYAIFRLTINRLYRYLRDYVSIDAYWAIRDVINLIPTLIVPIVCIVIGVKLIRSTNINKNKNTDDFVLNKSE